MMNAEEIFYDLTKIRERSPIIHSITNYVVMNSTANALLALGASPIMAHAPEEMVELVNISQALVINIGTLDSFWLRSMILAAQTAQTKKIPIILDPVGSGASKFRTNTCLSLLEKHYPTVIRGNASEIQSLVDALPQSKGVDSMIASQEAEKAGNLLSKKYQCVVSISGKEDIHILNDEQMVTKNGHAIMTKVTGMGCTSTTFVAAFNVVNSNVLQATAHAMAVMGIAGEIAYKHSNGPGSFQVAFYDAVYNLSLQDIQTYLLT